MESAGLSDSTCLTAKCRHNLQLDSFSHCLSDVQVSAFTRWVKYPTEGESLQSIDYFIYVMEVNLKFTKILKLSN